eukprot:gene42670-10792_t
MVHDAMKECYREFKVKEPDIRITPASDAHCCHMR